MNNIRNLIDDKVACGVRNAIRHVKVPIHYIRDRNIFCINILVKNRIIENLSFILKALNIYEKFKSFHNSRATHYECIGGPHQQEYKSTYRCCTNLTCSDFSIMK